MRKHQERRLPRDIEKLMHNPRLSKGMMSYFIHSDNPNPLLLATNIVPPFINSEAYDPDLFNGIVLPAKVSGLLRDSTLIMVLGATSQKDNGYVLFNLRDGTSHFLYRDRSSSWRITDIESIPKKHHMPFFVIRHAYPEQSISTLLNVFKNIKKLATRLYKSKDVDYSLLSLYSALVLVKEIEGCIVDYQVNLLDDTLVKFFSTELKLIELTKYKLPLIIHSNDRIIVLRKTPKRIIANTSLTNIAFAPSDEEALKIYDILDITSECSHDFLYLVFKSGTIIV